MPYPDAFRTSIKAARKEAMVFIKTGRFMPNNAEFFYAIKK